MYFSLGMLSDRCWNTWDHSVSRSTPLHVLAAGTLGTTQFQGQLHCMPLLLEHLGPLGFKVNSIACPCCWNTWDHLVSRSTPLHALAVGTPGTTWFQGQLHCMSLLLEHLGPLSFKVNSIACPCCWNTWDHLVSRSTPLHVLAVGTLGTTQFQGRLHCMSLLLEHLGPLSVKVNSIACPCCWNTWDHSVSRSTPLHVLAVGTLGTTQCQGQLHCMSLLLEHLGPLSFKVDSIACPCCWNTWDHSVSRSTNAP